MRIRKNLLYLFALIVLVIGSWLAASNLLGTQGFEWLFFWAIAAWLVLSALMLSARKTSARVWVFSGLLLLLGMSLPTSLITKNIPSSLALPFGVTFIITLLGSFALVNAALLLNYGLNLSRERLNARTTNDEDTKAQHQLAGKTAAICFILCILLIAKAFHNLYWLLVWDSTTDSLGPLWSVFPILAALLSGVILSNNFRGSGRLVGPLFLLLLPALIIVLSAQIQKVGFHQLTENRAERISRAIETFYVREGHYPRSLQQLTPWYMLSLPGPVILYRQDWCYDGGDDYYRLGYVYREHWSDPRLSGRIYKTEGDEAGLQRMCEQEIAAIQIRYPEYPYEYWLENE